MNSCARDVLRSIPFFQGRAKVCMCQRETQSCLFYLDEIQVKANIIRFDVCPILPWSFPTFCPLPLQRGFHNHHTPRDPSPHSHSCPNIMPILLLFYLNCYPTYLVDRQLLYINMGTRNIVCAKSWLQYYSMLRIIPFHLFQAEEMCVTWNLTQSRIAGTQLSPITFF